MQMDINEYVNQITNLKRELITVYKTDEKRAGEILRTMRQIHGSAIMADLEKQLMIDRTKKATPEQLVDLSMDASLIHVIHGHIRCCEKTLFSHKRGDNSSQPNVWLIDEDKTTSFSTAMENKQPEVSQLSDKTEILSIEIPKSETVSAMKATGGKYVESDADFGTTEAARMFEEYNINTPQQAPAMKNAYYAKGGNNKSDSNAVVLFHANWCPACKTFMPNWLEAKKQFMAQYPNASFTEYDVERDTKKVEIAKMAGVKAYPTVYARKGDHVELFRGSSILADLKKFADKNF